MTPKPVGILPPKGRRDHIVPQGFLRGFLAPSQTPKLGRLQVYELPTGPWQERTIEGVCYKIGFYDYSDLTSADATADEAFHDLENKISSVREDIRECIREAQYLKWERHRDYLVAFFQMLRVRGELFRAQVRAEQKSAGSYLQIKEWISGTTFRYEERKWADTPDFEDLLKNKSITDARSQIAKGSGDWAALSWTLGVTDIGMPFVTSDVPVVMSGPGPVWKRELDQGTFWIGVPLRMGRVSHRNAHGKNGPVHPVALQAGGHNDKWRASERGQRRHFSCEASVASAPSQNNQARGAYGADMTSRRASRRELQLGCAAIITQLKSTRNDCHREFHVVRKPT